MVRKLAKIFAYEKVLLRNLHDSERPLRDINGLNFASLGLYATFVQ